MGIKSRSEIYISRVKNGSYKGRLEYVERLKSLHGSISGSKLQYEVNTSMAFKDLVLVDKKGIEIARVTSTNPVGWICNHFFVEAKYE